MRREIEAEEEAYNKDGVNRCPGCNKIVANMVDALKAHAFAKIECRGAVPVEMRREIEAEEEAYKKNGVSRCLGCHKIVANMGDALKAHAFAKVACRAAVPVEMRREIEAEQEAYKKSEVNRCPGCQKIVADSADTLKAHAWSKVACRVATPTETRREIEAEEQSHKMEDVSWCLGRQIEEKEVCLFARKRKSSAMPSEYERSICSGNGSPQGWGNGGWCDGRLERQRGAQQLGPRMVGLGYEQQLRPLAVGLGCRTPCAIGGKASKYVYCSAKALSQPDSQAARYS